MATITRSGSTGRGGIVRAILGLVACGGLVLSALPKTSVISPHAAKHDGQVMTAETISAMILEGKCGPNLPLELKPHYCQGTKEMELCMDPVTGRIGGIFRVGARIITGYAARASYWATKVERHSWQECE